MTIEGPKTTHNPNTADDTFLVHGDMLSVGAASTQVIVNSQVTFLDVDGLCTSSSATVIDNTSSFLDCDEDEDVDETALNELDGISSHLKSASNTVKEKRYSKKTHKNYSYYLIEPSGLPDNYMNYLKSKDGRKKHQQKTKACHVPQGVRDFYGNARTKNASSRVREKGICLFFQEYASSVYGIFFLVNKAGPLPKVDLLPFSSIIHSLFSFLATSGLRKKK
jgi:hypothetical protein